MYGAKLFVVPGGQNFFGGLNKFCWGVSNFEKNQVRSHGRVYRYIPASNFLSWNFRRLLISAKKGCTKFYQTSCLYIGLLFLQKVLSLFSFILLWKLKLLWSETKVRTSTPPLSTHEPPFQTLGSLLKVLSFSFFFDKILFLSYVWNMLYSLFRLYFIRNSISQGQGLIVERCRWPNWIQGPGQWEGNTHWASLTWKFRVNTWGQGWKDLIWKNYSWNNKYHICTTIY